MLRVFVSLALVFTVAEGFATKAQFPPYLERCSKSDPNLNECFVKNGNKAIQFLARGDSKNRIPTFVTYQLPELVFRDDEQVKFVVKNVYIFGLDRARLTKVKVDFDYGTLTQDLIIPKLSIFGDYELNGRVIGEEVQGKGKANITIVNAVYTTKLTFEVDENQRAVPEESITTYKPQVVVYNLRNLFAGNEFRGYQTNVYLNNNWRNVNKEFEEGTAKYINDLITLLYKNIAAIVPADQLYLP